MSLQLIDVGKHTDDARGDFGRIGFIKINAMFQELFPLAGLSSPQIINIGTYAKGADPTVVTVFPVLPIKAGETSQSAFTKINDNFALIFSRVGIPPPQPQVINLGTGLIGVGQPVAGRGDPARVAGEKINANFTYLYQVL